MVSRRFAQEREVISAWRPRVGAARNHRIWASAIFGAAGKGPSRLAARPEEPPRGPRPRAGAGLRAAAIYQSPRPREPGGAVTSLLLSPQLPRAGKCARAVLGPGRPLNFLGRGGRRFAAGAIKVELPPLRCVKLWGLRILRSLRRQLRKNTCDTATQLQAHLTLTRTFNACCLRQHGAKLLPTDGPKLLPPLVSDLADRCMPESRESTTAHRGQ